MFDYSLAHWGAFFAAAFALNLSPGPDIAFILGRTVQAGRRAGFAAMGGLWTGALGHVLFATLGLSAILAQSASVFTAVKWAGAGYLIWLGIKTLRNSGGSYVAGNGPVMSIGQSYRQGVLVNLMNPKVAVFFLAFLPQFVEPSAGPVWAQIFLHGVLIIFVAACVEPLVILAGDRLARGLRDRPQVGVWLDRVVGGILIGFGLKLAAARL
ncbi:LysE family translocator [Tropicimonas sp. S265A]|uniref:LysE family translocator n=1 Tax=Tropicimonas sp. S265A TaxID=3415134 RepID=UPI003C7D1727